MSFFKPKKQSAPAPEQITSTQPIAPTIDTTLPQPTTPDAAQTLLTDVKNPSLIEETRRRANVLGSAAATLG